MTFLYLDNTQVADVTPLAALDRLQFLYLCGTQVANIAPLAALEKLQILYLYNTQVADIAPLREAVASGRLKIRGGPEG